MKKDTFNCTNCEENHPIDFRAKHGFEAVPHEIDDDYEEVTIYYESCYNCDPSAVAGMNVSSGNEIEDNDLPF